MGKFKREVMSNPFKKAVVKETSEICTIEIVDVKKGRKFYFVL